MLVLILVTVGMILAVIAISVLILQKYRITKGKIIIDSAFNGPEQVSTMLLTVIRFVLKKSIHTRKFLMQYFFHAMVRFMYHFDLFTTKMYAKSRNWFVKNAVKNKGTVPHFWEHLKVYKQEMDQEREREDDIR